MRSFAPHAITRAALILVALAATNARAQSILPLVPGANGSIRALAVSGNSLYIGGSFTQLGRYTGAGAAVDGTNGALSIVSPAFVSSPDFQPGGLVFATCDDGSGGWFAGGIFSTVGGQSRKNLVHILADGSVAAWNADASAPVRALLRSGSTLYVGGDFATLGGQSRANLGAVDTGTGNVLAWNPGADGPVFAFALSGSTLYVGGQFLHLAGQARSTIGAVDTGTGAATAWAPVIAGADIIRTIAPGTSVVYFGGRFTGVNGHARAGLAAVDPATGATTTAWKPDPNGNPRSIIPIGADVFVAGEFTSIGGQARIGVAKLNSTNGNADSGWNAACDDLVYDMRLDGGSLLLGGAFVTIGGLSRPKAATIAIADGAPGAWSPAVNGWVESLTRSGSRVFLGGYFTLADFVNRTNLAAIDLPTLHVTSWDPGISGGDVHSLATDGSTLYVGGIMTQAGGASRRGLAAFSVTTGALLPFDAHLNLNNAMFPDIVAMSLETGTLRVGGQFQNVSGTARNNAAAVDPITGALQAWAPEPNGPVKSMATSAGGVFLAGIFSSAGGQSRSMLAQVDATSGAATAWVPPVFAGMYRANGTYQDPQLFALAIDGTHLYVGGSFYAAGGLVRGNGASLDIGSGAVEGWSPPGSMVVGGPYGIFAFETASDPVFVAEIHPFLNGLLALDAGTGSAASWPPVVGPVRALARWNQYVILGGDFTTIGGQSAGGLALVSDPSVLDAGDRDPRVTTLAMTAPAPQPARERAFVTLSLPHAAAVTVRVIDAMGRVEHTVVDGAVYTAGRHPVSIDVAGLAPGIHWLHVRAGDERIARKLVVTR